MDKQNPFTAPIPLMPPHRRRSAEPKEAESFPEKLARLRKERGLSQVELAAKLGISQPNVSQYERGETKPGFDVLFDLARVLSVSADELLGLKYSPPQPVVKDRRLLHYLLLMERLPKRKKDALLMTVKAFLAHEGGTSRTTPDE